MPPGFEVTIGHAVVNAFSGMAVEEFEHWVNEQGQSFFKVELIYQSTEQLRSIQPLSLEVPPMIVPLSSAGVKADENGMIAEKDIMSLFYEEITMLPELIEKYTSAEMENAA